MTPNQKMLNVYRMKRQVLVFIAALLCSAFSFAQTGTIQGTISDAKNKETLIGATARIVGTQIGAATDVNGFFSINKVPAGKYTLEITYVSYRTETLPNITVESGKVTEVNIALLEASTTLSEVKIVSTRRTNTEVSVISEIKATQNIVSGISAQQIGKTLDRDAAQVVKRIPGVTIFNDKFINIRGLNQRYNTVLLHNAFAPSMESDSRSFSFDIIPSSQIDRLLVFKSPSAELPGEFAGGVVKIFTKGIPDETNITVDAGLSFRENTTGQDFLESPTGNNSWTGFNNGYLSLPKYFPSTRSDLISSSPERLQQVGQSLKNDWKPTQSTALPDQRLNITGTWRFDNDKIKIGNITAINYSSTYFTAKTQQRDFAPIGVTTERLINNFEDTRYTRGIRFGVMHNWAVRLSDKHSIEFKNLFNQLSNGQYIYRYGFDGNNNYFASNHSFDQVYRGIYTGQLLGNHKFSEKTKLDWVVGYNQSFRDQPDYRRFRSDVDKSTNTYNIYVPAGSAQPFFLGRTFLKLNENASTASVNVSHKLVKEIELKAGLFYEQKNRTFSARNLGYVRASQENFNLNLNQPIDQLFQPQNINPTNGLKIDEQTNASDSYTSSNDQIAGYVQGNIPLTKKLNAIVGIRVEKNVLKLNSALIDGSPINYNRDIFSVLPSSNFTYNFTQKSLLRFAYGKTLNRPEFREIAPFSFYDFTINRVIKGNPLLSNSNIHNLDFRYEYYPTPSEIISIAAFHKIFNDPIEVVFEGGANTTPIVSFSNGKKATSSGIELEVRKNLANLMPSLDKWAVVFNAALIYSRVKLADGVVGQSNNRPLQGQSPYIVNAGLNYNNQKKDLQVNILYNVIGKRIYAVGFNNGTTALYPDWYEMPRNIVDLTFAKGYGEHFVVKGGINDLFNQAAVILQDGNQDGKFQNNTDQVIQSYRPGRLISLGVAYKLFANK
ncbi:MAG: TonB-dependent receptor [Spirosomataceae bacterium]